MPAVGNVTVVALHGHDGEMVGRGGAGSHEYDTARNDRIRLLPGFRMQTMVLDVFGQKRFR